MACAEGQRKIPGVAGDRIRPAIGSKAARLDGGLLVLPIVQFEPAEGGYRKTPPTEVPP